MERKDDIIFNVENEFAVPAANAQNRPITTIVVDGSTAIDALDWYDARLSFDFSLQLLANGGNTPNAQQGIVNGAHTFVRGMRVIIDGTTVYNNTNADLSTRVKNLIDYSKPFVDNMGGSQMYYPDTSETTVVAENSGFAARRALLGTAANFTNVELPLNRCSFFRVFKEQLMPNCRVELRITFNDDANIVWKGAGADCRIIIRNVKIVAPRLSLNEKGQKAQKEYFKPRKRTYLRERIVSRTTEEQDGTFLISTGMNKPRHVFVWMTNQDKLNAQGQNQYLFNTFSIAANNANIVRGHLEAGDGIMFLP